jgi:hypothetical protein
MNVETFFQEISCNICNSVFWDYTRTNMLLSVICCTSVYGWGVGCTRTGLLDLLKNCGRRESKSSAQLPVVEVRSELKSSFLNALVNCVGVGLSLFPPCCRIVPKKFSNGSVFNLRVYKNLKLWFCFRSLIG